MSEIDGWIAHDGFRRYSQGYEDGIVLSALEIIASAHEVDHWCVEFGAGGGKALSNTANLIESHGCRGVMIEADAAKCGALYDAWKGNDSVTCVRVHVGWEGESRFDRIMRRLAPSVPVDFDFCSIDIDGNDYHVWLAMREYRPKLVCIEYNQTIPTDVRFIQPRDFSVRRGASILSLCELARDKGYELIAANCFNAFFVDKRFYPAFKIENNSPFVLRRDLQNVTSIFQSMDGEVFLHGFKANPWTGQALDERVIWAACGDPRYVKHEEVLREAETVGTAG